MKIETVKLHTPSKENKNSKIDLDIPRCAGIYLLFDEEQNLIYIGQTKNIRQRILQHMTDNNNSRLKEDSISYVTKIPFGIVSYFSYIPVEDIEKRVIYEQVLILMLKPTYNLM